MCWFHDFLVGINLLGKRAPLPIPSPSNPHECGMNPRSLKMRGADAPTARSPEDKRNVAATLARETVFTGRAPYAETSSETDRADIR